MAVPTWTTGQVLTASDVNTWFVPISAIKTANESVTSSTTLQNDDHLVIALAANSTYWVNITLIIDGATGGDFKADFTGPAGATPLLHVDGHNLSAAATTDDAITLMETFGDVIHIGTLGVGSHTAVSMRGPVSIAGTAGNMQLRWAQETSSASATRILTGSAMWARRIS